MRRWFPAIAVTLLAAGCPPKTPSSGVFPSLTELEGLAASQPRTEGLDLRVDDVESWTLEGDLPTTVDGAARAASDRWDALLSEAIGARADRIQMTEAMHCVATQSGRFQMERSAMPPDDLRTFIVARCGSAAATFRVVFQGVDHTADYPDRYVTEGLEPSVKALLKSTVGALDPERAWTAGIWRGRGETRSIVAIAVGERLARLEPVHLLPTDGHIEIRGESWVPAQRVSAFINRGRFGGGECESAADVAPPRFAFTCAVDESDARAWVEVSVAPPGRLLGRRVFTALTWPSGEPVATYQRPGFDRELPVGDGPADTLVRALNAVRTEGKLPAVSEIPAQSVLATRLAPHYFVELLSGSPTLLADRIVLGLAAGWKVRGLVRYGRVTSAWTGHSKDPHRLLASALEHPVSRSVLLDPRAEAIAVGPVTLEHQDVLGALVGMYAFVRDESQDERRRKVLDALDAARTAAGQQPGAPIDGLRKAAAQAVELIEVDGASPQQAHRDFMQRTAETVRRPVNGWVLQTRSLEDISFPPQLVSEPLLNLEIAVAYYQPAGDPWGRYVVLVVKVAPVKA